MHNPGLKTRIILYSIIPTGLIALFMIGFFSAKNYTNLNETLISRAKNIIYPLSTNASFAITQQNINLLQGLVNETFQNNSRNILGIAVFDPNNRMLVTSSIIEENNMLAVNTKENEFINPSESVEFTSDGIIMRMPIYAYNNESLLTLYGSSTSIDSKEFNNNEKPLYLNPKLSYPRAVIGYVSIYYLKGQLKIDSYADLVYSIILALLGLTIAFLFGISLIRMIIIPINKISSVIHEIRDGNSNVKVNGVMLGELERLRTYINAMSYKFSEIHNQMQFNVDTATNDLKDCMDKLHEHEHLLEIAKNDAEESAKIKNEFLANMSHELRTPLNGIIGFTRQLYKTCHDKQEEEYLNTIERSAQNLLSIVNNILDFTKLESQKLTLESIPFSLRRVCFDMINLLSPTAHNKGIELTVTISPKVHDSIIGDPMRIGQILTNLVGNALKFTKQGNVSLEVSLNDHFNISRNKLDLIFVVKDTGIGISKEQKDQLFSAFTQADTSITRKYGGTGLGLVITKHLIEQMDGHIELDSTFGQGTTVSFNIVVNKTITQIEQRNPKVTELRNKRIAVVENNTWVRNSLCTILSEWEIECIPMSNLHLINTVGDNTLDYIIIGLQKNFDFNQFMVAFSAIKNQKIKKIIIALNSLDPDPRLLELSDLICTIPKPVLPNKLLEAIINDDYLINQRKTLLDNKDKTVPAQLQNLTENVASKILNKKLIKASILAVDDNDANLLLIKSLLSDMVTEVFTASSGHEAIEQCLHSEFDLIFMDIQMPNLDGVATMKAIRQNATNAKTPIIAVTALVIASEQAKFISEGMNEVLAKPLDENELKNIVKKYCSHEEPKKEAQVLENKSNEETSSKTPTENKTNPTSIWNKELILKQCANKKDLAIDMIKMFASTIPDIKKTIDEREKIEPKKLSAAIHKFAGGSVYCGIKAIKEISNIIESEIKNGTQVSDLEPEFLELSDLIENAENNYQEWLKELNN